VHARILLFLYKRRREHAQDAGVAGFYVQEMLNCSEEHFDFHVWYLKAKDFIEITEQGALAITIQGVDHVISMSRNTMTEKLLIAQSDIPQD
jgi:curved DNA-binding protein